MGLRTKFFAVVASCLLLTVTFGGAVLERRTEPPFGGIILDAALIVVALLGVWLGTSWLVWTPLRRMAEAMERIAKEQAAGHPLTEALRADEIGRAARAFNQVVDAAHWTTVALQAANNDLERRVADRTAELERNALREVSDARDAHARLAAAEEKYRSIFEHATEGIFQTTLDGRCISANPAIVRLLGYESREQMQELLGDLGKHLYTDPAQRTVFLDKLRKDGRIEQFVTEVYRRDQRRIWISITARVVKNNRGDIEFLEGTVRDVTAQRLTELELRRSEAEARKLAIVASRTHNPVVITDAQGRLEWVNSAFTTLTGYTLDQVRGRKPGAFLQGPGTDPETVRQIREHVAAGRAFRVELLNYSRTGRQYWIAIDAEPVMDPDGTVQKYIAIEEDVTERKRAEWFEQDRRMLLEMVARNEPLTSTLKAICRAGERQCENVRGAILLDEQKRKYTVTAPQLPLDLVNEINALLLTCDLPVFSNCPGEDGVSVADAADDPRRAGFRRIASVSGIDGQSAMPIVSGHGAVLGELVFFHVQNLASPANETKIMQSLAGLAGLAIEHHQLTNRLAFQAKHDPLTGLPNRSELDTMLPLWVASAARENQVMAVLMIDLDGFKHVNDTLGHAVGDALLRQVTTRLSAATRGSDVLARTGGDEFTLVATELSTDQDAVRVADRLVNALAAPCEVDGRELFITSSVGIAVFPADGTDASSLQRSADAAMYAAKSAGRNQAMRYDPQMSVADIERLELEGHLRRALENNELRLKYQPQVNRSGVIVGVEALLRWTHPRLGEVSPARFIPVAEQSGLIVPIGTWVLREACRQAKVWQTDSCPPVCVAVNVSALQFQQPNFVSLVDAALTESALEPTLLELELTESMLVTNMNDVLKKLSELRAMGVGIAIDDFGTGYSSLAYLQKLPIDRLKIDQSFVRELTSDAGQSFSQTAVISAIVSLAGSLGKGVVAEGVETVAQRDYLIDIGCGTLQGYLYSPPVSAEQIESILHDRRMKPVRLAIPA